MKKMLKKALVISILAWIIFPAVNAVAGNDLLKKADIDTLENLSGIKYDDIDRLYRTALSDERLGGFRERLRDSIEASDSDAVIVPLDIYDGVVMKYLSDVFNLSKLAPYNIDGTNYVEGFYKPLYPIFDKWYDDNAMYISDPKIKEKYISDAVPANFLHRIQFPFKRELEQGKFNFDRIMYINDLVTNYITYEEKIRRLKLSYFNRKYGVKLSSRTESHNKCNNYN